MKLKSVFKILLAALPAVLLACSCSKTEAADIAVESVIISEQSVELTVGQSRTLTTSVRPSAATDGSIVWSSTKASVASVDADGKVTALAQGHTYVVAQNPASGVKASCLVSVNPIPAYNLIVKNSDGIEVGDNLYACPGMSFSLTVSTDDSSEHSFEWTAEGDATLSEGAAAEGTLTAGFSAFAPAEGYLHYATATVRVQTEDGFYKEFTLVNSIASTFLLGSADYESGSNLSLADGKTTALTLLWNDGSETLQSLPPSAFSLVSSDENLISFSLSDGQWQMSTAAGHRGDAAVSLKIGDQQTELCAVSVAIDPDRDGTIEPFPYENY